MKKKVFTALIVLFCLCASTAIVSASESSVIKGTIGKIAMYLNGNKIPGKIITVNKTNYVPVSILNDYLGFNVSTKANKINITTKEDVSKLHNQIDSLTLQNETLTSNLEDLQYKLRFYSGGKEDYTGETEDNYFTNVNNATTLAGAVWPQKNNGFIKTPRDNKADTWYKVEVSEGKGLVVALKAQIDLDYLNLCLYDSNGNALSGTFSASNGKYTWVSKEASTDTTYYAKVSGTTGIYYIGFYDYYKNNPSALNDERDFFGSLYTAKQIYSGSVARTDENLFDFYRADLREGQTISVSITPQIDSGYVNLQLYDKEGNTLSSTMSASNGKTASITKKASTDCTYFIKVSGATGNYFLNYSAN